MNSSVTSSAKCDTVRYVVSQLRVWPPRLDVMYKQIAPVSLAFLASIIVTIQHCLPKSNILWFFVFSWPQRRVSALPVWVIRTNQVRVVWWTTTGPLATSPNRCFVFRCQRATRQRFRDTGNRFYPGLSRHHVVCPTGFSNGRDFSPHIWSLGHVAMEIGPCHAA